MGTRDDTRYEVMQLSSYQGQDFRYGDYSPLLFWQPRT